MCCPITFHWKCFTWMSICSLLANKSPQSYFPQNKKVHVKCRRNEIFICFLVPCEAFPRRKFVINFDLKGVISLKILIHFRNIIVLIRDGNVTSFQKKILSKRLFAVRNFWSNLLWDVIIKQQWNGHYEAIEQWFSHFQKFIRVKNVKEMISKKYALLPWLLHLWRKITKD